MSTAWSLTVGRLLELVGRLLELMGINYKTVTGIGEPRDSVYAYVANNVVGCIMASGNEGDNGLWVAKDMC